jgi:hypothetical protein
MPHKVLMQYQQQEQQQQQQLGTQISKCGDIPQASHLSGSSLIAPTAAAGCADLRMHILTSHPRAATAVAAADPPAQSAVQQQPQPQQQQQQLYSSLPGGSSTSCTGLPSFANMLVRIASVLASLQDPSSAAAGLSSTLCCDDGNESAHATAAAAAASTRCMLQPETPQLDQQLQHFAGAAKSLRQALRFVFAGCYGDASLNALRPVLQAATQHSTAVEGSGLLALGLEQHEQQLLLVSLVDLREEGCIFPLQRTPLHMLVSNVLVSADALFVPQGYCSGWYDLSAAAAAAEAFGVPEAAKAPRAAASRAAGNGGLLRGQQLSGSMRQDLLQM